MKLTSFAVQNYRSVNDSGEIEIGDRTALVGRNESGKSNLLLALQSLNPPSGVTPLNFTKDFPRDRGTTDFSDSLTVVVTTWTLTDTERLLLARIFPRAASVATVTISRDYKGTHYFGFEDIPSISVDTTRVGEHLKKISQSLNGSLKSANETAAANLREALSTLADELEYETDEAENWASSAPQSITNFRAALTVNCLSPSDLVSSSLAAIEAHAISITKDGTSEQAAMTWLGKQLPVFIYVSEYPELNGHQNIPEYLSRKANGQLTEADLNFEKLMKVAELDPVELNDALHRQPEDRQLLTNRAGARVSAQMRERWTDRRLKVRFSLDAAHFNTLISDPNATYDIEVNLDERSRGFKWFFSFYVTFAADTKGGPAQNSILLLDEPGLYLHATAQNDLLSHFAANFGNQIIYTTHSPFMIAVDDLAAVKTVNIDEEQGTTVTNDPTGDSRTLFPLQTALGYVRTQTMFVGNDNLIVEGVIDYWYLSSISDYLRDIGGRSLPPDLVITPGGGAQKVSYMVALLTAQRLNVLVLLDHEQKANQTADDLVKDNLIRKQNLISIADAYTTTPKEADIEDLIDPVVFEQLVAECYASELAAHPISLNPHLPRIVPRYEAAFAEAGMEFHKSRPAKLFIRKIATDPSIMTPITQERFERLFEAKRTAMRARSGRPFD